MLLHYHALTQLLFILLYLCETLTQRQVAFLALGQVHPITHAVGNTIKRVVVLVASVIAFNHKMRPMSIGGSALAVTGTLLYSLAKNRYA
jgi:solute carrier family 35, member E1